MSNGWECIRPGHWKLGASGWWVQYGDLGTEGNRGWWLRYWEKLLPANPFPTLSAAQEYAATHHPNGQLVSALAMGWPGSLKRTRHCGDFTAHKEHLTGEAVEPDCWCPGTNSRLMEYCKQDLWHEPHIWAGGRWCPGFRSATLMSTETPDVLAAAIIRVLQDPALIAAVTTRLQTAIHHE